ncbi:MAG: hypothetical protein U1F68_01130 [Gammaproteobacteria bacterium]
MNAATLAGRDLATLADDMEALAYADLYAAAPPFVKASLGLEVLTLAGATLLLAPRLPVPMFNRVIGVGLRRPADLDTIDAIAEIYRRQGSASWWLHWNPYAAPSDLAEQLPKLGFTQPARRSWAKMARGRQAPPAIPTDLEIVPVVTERAEQVTLAITQAFAMPPIMAAWLQQLHGRPRWHLYEIAEQGRSVGGGCLFVSGECAWLGMGGVLESHRRRGGQGALMARRITDAIALGAQQIVTETGEAIGAEPNPSLANMRRCGFSLAASRLNFARNATEQR